MPVAVTPPRAHGLSHRLGQAPLPRVLNTAPQGATNGPAEMTFSVIFVDILVLKAMEQNAEGPCLSLQHTQNQSPFNP